MKKTFFSALMLLSCYTQSNAQEYYEKHLEFPPQATVEELSLIHISEPTRH